MRKKHYTFEQHQELGEELYHMRNRLLQIHCELGRVYNRKLSGLAAKSHSSLDQLRCDLDSLVFQEYPERTTQELVRTYYCANRIKCSAD